MCVFSVGTLIGSPKILQNKALMQGFKKKQPLQIEGESITCVGKKRLNLTSIQLLRRSVFDNRFRQATLRQFGLTYKQICSFPNMYTQRQHMYYV